MLVTNVYPPGTVILFSEGEYSDFGYCGEIVTLKQRNIPDLIDGFKAAKALTEGEDGTSYYTRSEFVAWLIMTGYAAPLECSTVHLGSYGELEIDK